ncbi:glycosyl transferase [Agaricicola taiwanensis]|uniref:Glycosyl transferase n=1 Tax=Agaricicola taiwanensis TaxID=591372 RepID=A0A8J2VNB2_9RHOB|nr:glycosyltransferase family 4 protein [Agaricicola taiwanensis]GGE32246.1 glycosyl transferase [Agaricicola taiwanensis]
MMTAVPPAFPIKGRLRQDLGTGARPERVLMTLDAIGGVWRYAMDLGTGLKQAGVEVVFAGFGPLPSPGHAEEARTIGTLVWLKAPLDWMVTGAAELTDVPHLLQGLIEDHDIDLVHLNLPSQGYRLQASVPVVVVSHSCVVTWFKAVRQSDLPDYWSWQKACNRAGFDTADAVVAPSQAHADLLSACYGVINNLTVIPNAVREPASPAAKKEIVFAAARWWDDSKNGLVLDQAASKSLWPVVMAGPTVGPNGQAISLAHAHSPGEIASEEVRQRVASAGIFVSPSIYEPFGLAALEAARAEAALVLADIPTYRELWRDVALFADPRDPDSFASAINTLVADPERRQALGRSARARSQRFSTEAQTRSYLDLYRHVMSHSPQLATAI